MAVYRQVHTTFWQDPFVLDLTYKEKFFYLYLLTNSKTTQCGIYEISEKVMALETDLSKEEIEELLDKFVSYGKIRYNKKTKEIFLCNWAKYNPINNINVKKCVVKELENVKCEEFKQAFIGICNELGYELEGAYKGLARGYDTPTKTPCKKKEKEKEKEKEEEKEKELLQEEKNSSSNSVSSFEKEFAHLLDLYQQVIGTINSLTSEWLECILKDYGFEWCKSAIIEADKRGKRTKKYVEGILQNWKTSGGMRLSNDENSRKIDYEASAKSKYGW